MWRFALKVCESVSGNDKLFTANGVTVLLTELCFLHYSVCRNRGLKNVHCEILQFRFSYWFCK